MWFKGWIGIWVEAFEMHASEVSYVIYLKFG
jgi:hypothetical protein